MTSRVSILTSSRWGGGANDCTSTKGIHGKMAASPSEWSLAAYRSVAAPHKVPVPSSGPLLNHKRNVEGQLQYRTTGYNKMNSDEMNWLLQTIEDPKTAKRFVQAQYRRGRIPYQVMASLARERNWTNWPAVEKPAALIVNGVELLAHGGVAQY